MSAEKPRRKAHRTAAGTVGRPFAPGVSGNPSGRPKMPAGLKEAARLGAEDAIYVARRILARTIRALDAADDGARVEMPHSDALLTWAGTTCLDRHLGKPAQAVTVSRGVDPLAGVPEEQRPDVLGEMIEIALAKVAAKRQAALQAEHSAIDVPALPVAQLEAAVPVDPKPDPEKP